MIKYCDIKNTVIGHDRVKVCVPLVATNEEEILKQADEIINASNKETIDIIEFRADYYEQLNDLSRLSMLLKELQARFIEKVFLFTIRSEKEGGEKLSFATPSILDINKFVIENRLADMVDIELFSIVNEDVSLIKLAQKNGVKIVMSNHDFNTTPSVDQMVVRLRSMQDIGADIAKIAVMPENRRHVLNLLEATSIMSEQYAKIPIVTISMGELGKLTRVSGGIFGSAVTFSSLDRSSAPGQIPLEKLNNLLDEFSIRIE